MAIEGWEYLLAIICIYFSLVFSIYYFIQFKKTDEGMKSLKDLNKGFSLMYLFLFISRFFDTPFADIFNPANNIRLFGIKTADQLLYDALFVLTSNHPLITINMGSGETTISNWMIVNMFFLLGIAIAVRYVEKTFIQKSHGVFYYILVLAAFLSIIIALIPFGGENIDFFQSIVNNPQKSPLGIGLSYSIAVLGYVSFAVLTLIYWGLAARTTGKVRWSSIMMGFGILLILVDLHTVGHGSGGWERSVPTMLGFVLIIIANAGFKRMMPVMLDFYKTRRKCVVCKSNIKGKVFMCSKCNVFYCLRCKDAIINGENKCWSCKTVLDKSRKYTDGDISIEEKDVELIEKLHKRKKSSVEMEGKAPVMLEVKTSKATALFAMKSEMEKESTGDTKPGKSDVSDDHLS